MASKIKNYRKLDKIGGKMIKFEEEILSKSISYVNCCDKLWLERDEEVVL